MAVAAVPRPSRALPAAVPQPIPEVAFGAAIALTLIALGLRGGGGVALESNTAVEICMQLLGGLLAAVAVLAHDGRRVHGAGALALMAVLTVLTAFSILWAVEPADAWLEASRMLAYLAVFAAGLALGREAGALWSSVLGGVLAFSVVVSGYAVLTKMLPAVFAEDEIYARLREPYEYWNAVGLTAAMGMPLALWLGARRHGHAGLNALAFPILALQILTILLAYSRGALLAGAIGVALWFALVPLRLRGAVVLAVAAVGVSIVATWAFGEPALTEDRVSLLLRRNAGAQFGIVLISTLAALSAIGLAIGFASARRAPSAATRQTAGAAILVVLALVPVAFVTQLAFSDRGLSGSLSEGWRSLTDPDARTPANTPDRLTAVGSVRAAYWDQALQIWADHRLEGAGAGAYPTARRRYRKDELVVRHAHGYAVQVAADLGWLGLLTNLALLVAFLAAALRAAGLRVLNAAARERLRLPPPRSAPSWDPERVGLVTLLAVVVTFGFHSFVDWTWYTPATAIAALLCAGFLAGRGPGAAADLGAVRDRVAAGMRSPVRVAGAVGVLLVAVACAYATWQPLRSVRAGDAALDALDAGGPQAVDRARALALKARDRNPLAVGPLFELGAIESAAGRKDAARAALDKAVALQPDNPETWLRSAEFALRQSSDARRAIDLLGPALYLDPRSDQAQALYLEAARMAGGVPGAPAAAGKAPGTP